MLAIVSCCFNQFPAEDREQPFVTATIKSTRFERGSHVLLALTTVGFSLLAIPMGMATIMSPMAFDSGETVSAWILVVAVVSFIPLVGVAIPTAWILHRKEFYRAAMGVCLLPSINLFVVAGVFLIAPRFS